MSDVVVHKGVTIAYSPAQMDFTAKIAGKLVRAPSLQAMKAKIDKSINTAFEPFAVVRIEELGYGHGRRWKLVKGTATGIVVEGRKTRYSEQTIWFEVDYGIGYARKEREPVLDTPANREILQKIMIGNIAAQDAAKAWEATREKLNARLDKKKPA